MAKVILSISGMSCSACSNSLEKYLNKQKGIKNATVNLVLAQALIEYDESLTITDLNKFVEEAGFKSLGIYNEKKETKKENNKQILLIFTLLVILVLYISMAHMARLPEIPFLSMKHHPINYTISLLVLTVPFLIYGFDIFKSGYKNLLHKSPNMDTLVSIGVLASFIYSLVGTFLVLFKSTSYMETIYYESVVTVIYFIKLGRYIDRKSKEKTKEALQELVTITPSFALLKIGNKEKEVTIDEVKKGDILICKPGMKIAVDGTITKGKLNVSKIYNYSNIEENDILQDIASIENKSEHPIARAIVNEAENRKLTLKGVKEFKALSGLGVTGIVDENKYVIGNLKLMNENNITVNNDKDFNSLINDGNSVLFVGRNEELVALLGVKDTLKENIKDVISNIKAKEIDVIMLTGDNEKTANVVAKEASIEKVIANVLPSQKADVVKELKKDGIVMMCGDGINDSVSLVTADIGVSVSSGTDIAMDSSNVVIMNDNLDRINDLILISKKTITNIKQNLFWAFAYNICMIPIAMGIFTKFNIVMNPMFGSMAMTLSSLTVVLNALRLKNIKFKKH